MHDRRHLGQGSACHILDYKLFTNLSFGNIRGVENLIRMLRPADFPNPRAEGCRWETSATQETGGQDEPAEINVCA